MRLVVIITIFLHVIFLSFDLCAQYASPDDYEKNAKKSVVIKHKLDGNVVKVVAKLKKFDLEGHVLNEGDFIRTIDGQKILGGDGGFARSNLEKSYEFETLNVYLNKKEMPIDKKFYTNCIDPIISDDRFFVTLGDDLQSVFIFMQGSDAAGTYEVVWVFRSDGHHSRITYTTGDISIFGDAVSSGELNNVNQRAMMK